MANSFLNQRMLPQVGALKILRLPAVEKVYAPAFQIILAEMAWPESAVFR